MIVNSCAETTDALTRTNMRRPFTQNEHHLFECSEKWL